MEDIRRKREVYEGKSTICRALTGVLSSASRTLREDFPYSERVLIMYFSGSTSSSRRHRAYAQIGARRELLATWSLDAAKSCSPFPLAPALETEKHDSAACLQTC